MHVISFHVGCKANYGAKIAQLSQNVAVFIIFCWSVVGGFFLFVFAFCFVCMPCVAPVLCTCAVCPPQGLPGLPSLAALHSNQILTVKVCGCGLGARPANHTAHPETPESNTWLTSDWFNDYINIMITYAANVLHQGDLSSSQSVMVKICHSKMQLRSFL